MKHKEWHYKLEKGDILTLTYNTEIEFIFTDFLDATNTMEGAMKYKYGLLQEKTVYAANVRLKSFPDVDSPTDEQILLNRLLCKLTS